MGGLLYKLAIRYIEQYNMHRRSLVDRRDIQRLSRLTYRSNTGWAYLFYGNDAEWSKFSRYDVLENAIQKLADYEDKEDTVLRKDEKNMSLAKLCDRCGKYYKVYNEKNDKKHTNGFVLLNIDKHGKYFSHSPIDLCPKCMESLINWRDSSEDESKEMRRKLSDYCFSVEECAGCIFKGLTRCNFKILSDSTIRDLYKKLKEEEEICH
nr:MAG TPA: hypothetical protein [Bacteriophage sp.]